MLKNDASVPMVNIFKQKRVKGWWPFYVKKENEEMELTVSVASSQDGFKKLSCKNIEENIKAKLSMNCNHYTIDVFSTDSFTFHYLKTCRGK